MVVKKQSKRRSKERELHYKKTKENKRRERKLHYNKEVKVNGKDK